MIKFALRSSPVGTSRMWVFSLQRAQPFVDLPVQSHSRQSSICQSNHTRDHHHNKHPTQAWRESRHRPLQVRPTTSDQSQTSARFTRDLAGRPAASSLCHRRLLHRLLLALPLGHPPRCSHHIRCKWSTPQVLHSGGSRSRVVAQASFGNHCFEKPQNTQQPSKLRLARPRVTRRRHGPLNPAVLGRASID